MQFSVSNMKSLFFLQNIWYIWCLKLVHLLRKVTLVLFQGAPFYVIKCKDLMMCHSILFYQFSFLYCDLDKYGWSFYLIWSSFTAFTFLWACKSNFPVENDNFQVENHSNTFSFPRDLELFNGHWTEIMVKSYRRNYQLHAECKVHATVRYSSCMCCITRVASIPKSSQKYRMYLQPE